MATPEHLQILQQGVEAWNQWRRRCWRLKPNLAEADLSRADLTGADLGGANLTRTDLSGADLTRASLLSADLTSAAPFRATLTTADLTAAILTAADLTGTTLRGSTLTRADLSEAVLLQTVFGDINLTTVRGLATCHHAGPSILDYSTLATSGPLPPAFLQGCGLNDWGN
jgi:uncharacterized protein YjbI with pentapeptide repeats